jgi:mRNA interferase RelE/StbE
MSAHVTILYSHDALRQLKKLDKTIAQRIVRKIYENAHQPDVLSRGKPLRGRLSGKYRYRIGDYRVIFVVDENGSVAVLTVLSVAHRREVYR